METAEALKSRSESPEGPAIAAGVLGVAAAMRWESVRRREARRRVWAEVRLEFEHGGERFGLEWRRKRRPAEVVAAAAAAAAAAMVSDSGEAGACLIAKWDGIFIFLLRIIGTGLG
jgi:hypothetical protein